MVYICARLDQHLANFQITSIPHQTGGAVRINKVGISTLSQQCFNDQGTIKLTSKLECKLHAFVCLIVDWELIALNKFDCLLICSRVCFKAILPDQQNAYFSNECDEVGAQALVVVNAQVYNTL